MLGPAKDIPPSEPAIAFLAAVHEAPWLASGAVVSLGMRTNLCPENLTRSLHPGDNDGV